MSFSLPDLPYARDALAPHMTAETFDFHYGKHHATYINKLNELIEGTDYAGKSLEDITNESFAKKDTAVFNNAAQHWNHSFFWNCMIPNGGGTDIPAELAAKIDSDLGGYDKFKSDFVNTCVTQFGSGWGWLVVDNACGKLEFFKTANADTPFVHGKTALLTCDVWEHAYYIDYRNARPKYVETFVDHLINWDFVLENFKAAQQRQAA